MLVRLAVYLPSTVLQTPILKAKEEAQAPGPARQTALCTPACAGPAHPGIVATILHHGTSLGFQDLCMVRIMGHTALAVEEPVTEAPELLLCPMHCTELPRPP